MFSNVNTPEEYERSRNRRSHPLSEGTEPANEI
jgi:hypothetical protein